LPVFPFCARLFSVHRLPDFAFSSVRLVVSFWPTCRFHSSGFAFFPDRVSVLSRPVLRFSLTELAFFKSPRYSWQDGNRITYGSLLPKGCALWTPGAFGASLLTLPKRQKT
jgi:hypothetical protein